MSKKLELQEIADQIYDSLMGNENASEFHGGWDLGEVSDQSIEYDVYRDEAKIVFNYMGREIVLQISEKQ